MPVHLRDNVRMLSTRTGTAMYVGAVLGPGVLFLPSLAARVAGPASVLAWAALLALSVPLAVTFAALGVRFPRRAAPRLTRARRSAAGRPRRPVGGSSAASSSARRRWR